MQKIIFSMMLTFISSAVFASSSEKLILSLKKSGNGIVIDALVSEGGLMFSCQTSNQSLSVSHLQKVKIQSVQTGKVVFKDGKKANQIVSVLFPGVTIELKGVNSTQDPEGVLVVDDACMTLLDSFMKTYGVENTELSGAKNK